MHLDSPFEHAVLHLWHAEATSLWSYWQYLHNCESDEFHASLGSLLLALKMLLFFFSPRRPRSCRYPWPAMLLWVVCHCSVLSINSINLFSSPNIHICKEVLPRPTPADCSYIGRVTDDVLWSGSWSASDADTNMKNPYPRGYGCGLNVKSWILIQIYPAMCACIAICIITKIYSNAFYLSLSLLIFCCSLH